MVTPILALLYKVGLVEPIRGYCLSLRFHYACLIHTTLKRGNASDSYAWLCD